MGRDINIANKWWYRLVQVFYCFFVVFLLVITIGVVIEYWPKYSVTNSRYHLECLSGEKRGDFDGSSLNYYGTEFDVFYSNGQTVDNMAKIICSKPDMSFEEAQKELMLGNIPTKQNYVIALTKKAYDGAWWHPILAGLLGLIGTTVISLLFRAIFQYIAFAKPFWPTLLLRKQKTFQRTEDVLTSL